MQVRYQAALRPEGWILPLELVEDGAEFALDRADVDAARGTFRAAAARGRFGPLLVRVPVVEAVAGTADGEPFLVQELADAADQQHLVVLVVAAVAAPLHGLELSELLLPVSKHVRLHPAELAHLTDGEVALRG